MLCIHCVNVLNYYFSVWTSGVSLINPGGQNKQSNLSETVSRCNSLEFNQAENSAKCELQKRETKNKNTLLRQASVKMPFTVCVKDGSDYVKIYSVYLTFFPFLFYTTNLFIRCHQHMQNRRERLVLKEVLYYPSFALWQSRKLSVNWVWVFV